jgi:hypothetical protein
MKIYVENDSLPLLLLLNSTKDNKNNIKLKKILGKIDKYLVKKEHVIDIYSKIGIYQVHENQIYKLHVKSETPHEDIILKTSDDKNITLLIDDSNTEKEIVNQLPYEHVKTQILTHIYSLNKKNNNGLFLVIEFIKNLEEENNVKPINYYFEYTQPLVKSKIGNTDIPLEDINVFLSLLN